jgi:hypothetical protein
MCQHTASLADRSCRRTREATVRLAKYSTVPGRPPGLVYPAKSKLSPDVNKYPGDNSENSRGGATRMGRQEPARDPRGSRLGGPILGADHTVEDVLNSRVRPRAPVALAANIRRLPNPQARVWLQIDISWLKSVDYRYISVFIGGLRTFRRVGRVERVAVVTTPIQKGGKT